MRKNPAYTYISKKNPSLSTNQIHNPVLFLFDEMLKKKDLLKIIDLFVTASDTSRQYVGLYLKIVVDKNLYPEEQSPKKIDLFQVRGLEEKQVRSLTKILQDLCDDPGPVLYTLMDACREYLTEHNYPTCPCSICQYHIVQEDSFVKTPCFHYFHSACFGRYLNVFKPISDEYEDDFSGTKFVIKFRYSEKATNV